jgi:hypothetical protein
MDGPILCLPYDLYGHEYTDTTGKAKTHARL